MPLSSPEVRDTRQVLSSEGQSGRHGALQISLGWKTLGWQGLSAPRHAETPGAPRRGSTRIHLLKIPRSLRVEVASWGKHY